MTSSSSPLQEEAAIHSDTLDWAAAEPPGSMTSTNESQASGSFSSQETRPIGFEIDGRLLSLLDELISTTLETDHRLASLSFSVQKQIKALREQGASTIESLQWVRSVGLEHERSS
jgi:hypothetical protein